MDACLAQGRWFLRHGPVGPAELQALRAEAREMFFFAYHNYMEHGFPKVSPALFFAFSPQPAGLKLAGN